MYASTSLGQVTESLDKLDTWKENLDEWKSKTSKDFDRLKNLWGTVDWQGQDGFTGTDAYGRATVTIKMMQRPKDSTEDWLGLNRTIDTLSPGTYFRILAMSVGRGKDGALVHTGKKAGYIFRDQMIGVNAKEFAEKLPEMVKPKPKPNGGGGANKSALPLVAGGALILFLLMR